MLPSWPEQFRRWYEYEKDCNAKVLAMLESVPADRRGEPAFARAVAKTAHLIAARHNWLSRLGVIAEAPVGFSPAWGHADLPGKFAEVESRWTAYLAGLDEAKLAASFEWVGYDGKRRRWRLMDLLTQVFGHAWYHRGQVAMLVKDLGGTPVDTDFIFWEKPEVLG